MNSTKIAEIEQNLRDMNDEVNTLNQRILVLNKYFCNIKEEEFKCKEKK